VEGLLMRRLGWLVAGAAVLVAGCGGKSSSNTTATTISGATATTGGGAPASSTVPSFSGPKNSKYCDLARQFSQTINPNLSSGDPKTLFQQFDALSAQYLAVVPSVIKGDANTVINAIRQLETAFKTANYDVTKIQAADLAPVQDPKFTVSANRINAYDSQVCGITTSTT
jgi:hypothetical protein